MSMTASPFSSPLAPPRPKNWFERHWLLAIVGSLIALTLLIVAFVGALLLIVEGSIKKSDAYTQAMVRAQNDPKVTEKLGEPLQPGWFISGNIQVTNDTGQANLSIPVSGPKSKGTIRVVAKKIAGSWQFDTLEVDVEGDSQPINLLDAKHLTPAAQ
jgi:hypothetical protein